MLKSQLVDPRDIAWSCWGTGTQGGPHRTDADPRPTPFKQCSCCSKRWASRDDFLADPAIHAIGYMANLSRPERGHFLFNHMACKTTLAIEVSCFVALYDGPRFTERKAETPECPEYCLQETELRPCPVHCECAYVRALLDTITHWPKGETPAGQTTMTPSQSQETPGLLYALERPVPATSAPHSLTR